MHEPLIHMQPKCARQTPPYFETVYIDIICHNYSKIFAKQNAYFDYVR